MNPLDHLPHRPPFRFLTTITAIEPGVCASGAWLVRGDEDFLRGHFPGDPVVPGVLIGEAMAQLSGLVGMHAHASARLARIDVRFRAAVVPPSEILLTSSLARELGGVSMYDVTARVGDAVVAEGTVVLGSAVGP